MTLELSQAELFVLRTAHGNTRASRDVRGKLRNASCKYCHVCDAVLPLKCFRPAASATQAADGRQGVCAGCSKRYRPKAYKKVTIYICATLRDAEKERQAMRARRARREA